MPNDKRAAPNNPTTARLLIGVLSHDCHGRSYLWRRTMCSQNGSSRFVECSEPYSRKLLEGMFHELRPDSVQRSSPYAACEEYDTHVSTMTGRYSGHDGRGGCHVCVSRRS
jgi:hypothetical protein